MRRDCQQQQQGNARPMLCGNNTKTMNATQERGAYDTTGTVKPEIRATNDNTWQTDKSKIRPEEPE